MCSFNAIILLKSVTEDEVLMNLKQLEVFVQVAESKSFSATAKQLFLTQPTVSAHIASLEKELNTCLLVRNTKGVMLSESGKALYSYAEQMLELEEKIKEHFGVTGRRSGSVLRIAASSVPSQYLLPEIMADFRKKYPNERLKLFETDSEKVVDMIGSHQADIGFTGTVIEKGSCKYIPFFEDELVIITPSTERFREMKFLPMTTWILDEPMIVREEGSGTRKEAEKVLSCMGIDASKLTIAAMMENQETIKRSVASGMGISLISALAVADEVAAGKLLSFSLSAYGGKRNINLVFDAGYPKLPSAERFIKNVEMIYSPDR